MESHHAPPPGESKESPTKAAVFSSVLVLAGGELAVDVAEQIVAKKPADFSIPIACRSMSDKPKEVPGLGADVLLVLVIQTIENAQPTEDGGRLLRFFKRKTHPADLMAGKAFACLGLGDSNLLLDRQTTTAQHCNQCAQELDARLATLGAFRLGELGLADERTGLTEVEPWIRAFWAGLS